MSSGSVNTNFGAMVALQSLQKTNKSMLETQSRISTGLKVGSASDDAAKWAISTVMKSDVATMKTISENLSVSSSSVAVAKTSAEKVSDLIKEIKSKVTSAQNSAMDKSKIQTDVDAYINQIKNVVGSASFNGTNMLNAAGTERVLSSIDRSASGVTASYIDVAKHNLNVTGGGLSDLDNISVLNRGDLLIGGSGTASTVVGTANAVAGTKAQEGTTMVNFANGAAFGAASTDFTLTYNDGSSNKTITVTKTAAGTGGQAVADALNGNSQFSALFYAEVGDTAAQDVRIMAKDRSSTNSIVSLGGSGTAGTMTAANMSTSTGLTFASNQPMKMGEVLQLDYTINGTDFSVKLQAADAANGTLLGTDNNGTKILALNSGAVTAFNATGAQIADAVKAALTSGELQTGGVNHFVQGGAATRASATGAAVDGASIGLNASGTANVFAATVDGTDKIRAFTPPVTDYQAVLDKVESALSTAIDAASAFGSAQKRINVQKEFVSALSDSLTQGISTLVDADLTEESARLQALQVQQQLGTQSLSIANQAPQALLSLFRG